MGRGERLALASTMKTALYTVLRLVLAAFGGWLAYLGYEPHGQWELALVGVALFIAALSPWGREQVGKRRGALLGFAHFFTCYLFLLPWVGEFVGAFPFVALSFFEALYGALIGAGGVILLRSRIGSLFFPLFYVAVEFFRSSWPFGGFAWVRLAWGQVDGPLSLLAPLGGPALVTAAAVTAALGLVLLFSRRYLAGVIALVTVATVSLGAFPLTNPGNTRTGAVTVAAIQGNVPRMGLDFNAQQRAVLANHVESTKKLSQPVDMVIWPENSSDVNPFADTQARELIEEAVDAVGAPILVGTITRDEIGPRNTMVVFDPKLGTGEYHHKKYLQPFGEWMPFRSFFRLFSSYVDQAGNFKPGTGNGLVHMVAAQLEHPVAVGVATCYEVAFDAAYRDAVRAGAQILATPTNNATFGFTDMTYQQLAMSRFRAMELDRAVVVAATSGVSAILAPDGTVISQTDIFTQDQLVATLPLKEGLTPAAQWGRALEWILTSLGLLALIGCAIFCRRPVTYAFSLTTVPAHSAQL